MSASTAPNGPLPKLPENISTINVGALVFDDADLLDIMGPMRIFGEELTKLNIKINFISSSLEPIRTSQQVKITPEYTLDNAPKMDLFFIPGGIGTRTYANDVDLLNKVKARVEEATWCMTVCTGAGVLAKTGLVDGHNMTTNKAAFEWPVSQGPNVNWIKKARWVQDGKFVSSSGVSAGIDAALYILSEWTSMERAEEVATYIEYSWHKVASDDPFADKYPYTRSDLCFANCCMQCTGSIKGNMAQFSDLQKKAFDTILAKTTGKHWVNYPDIAPLILELKHLSDGYREPDLDYLTKLMRLAILSDEWHSERQFLLLESYCAAATPNVFSQLLAQFILEAGEQYPSLPGQDTKSGWLVFSMDYKQEQARRGDMLRKLWMIASERGQNIEKLTIQRILVSLVEKSGSGNSKQDFHDILYMLHCGPLADQGLPLWDIETVINALAKLRDKSDQRAHGNQLLILTNILDRIFAWLESKDNEEDIEALKMRVASYTKIPELLLFAMDNIFKYLDGRWIQEEMNDHGPPPVVTSTSLMEINREREPIRFTTTAASGALGFMDNNHTARGRALKERLILQRREQEVRVQEYEISDLVARCIEGHDIAVLEQLMQRFMLFLRIKIETAMVGATTAALKHAAQQRSLVLICAPVLQAMLRCMVAHWGTCKNTSPGSYPKELEETTWLAQVIEQTGLIPSPINQASVLFALIESRDIGLLLEQCYYVLLVRNMDDIQHQQQRQQEYQGPELQLIRRLIFKHAAQTFHLMPLFATRPSPSPMIA
ncbi:hypothetical protein BGZ51_003298 [Haplosporangium sp. Z 767]|nr:hypothetical protein BGZ51_003298 [Haplosporangium sp. Z 767]